MQRPSLVMGQAMHHLKSMAMARQLHQQLPKPTLSRPSRAGGLVHVRHRQSSGTDAHQKGEAAWQTGSSSQTWHTWMTGIGSTMPTLLMHASGSSAGRPA